MNIMSKQLVPILKKIIQIETNQKAGRGAREAPTLQSQDAKLERFRANTEHRIQREIWSSPEAQEHQELVQRGIRTPLSSEDADRKRELKVKMLQHELALWGPSNQQAHGKFAHQMQTLQGKIESINARRTAAAVQRHTSQGAGASLDRSLSKPTAFDPNFGTLC